MTNRTVVTRFKAGNRERSTPSRSGANWLLFARGLPATRSTRRDTALPQWYDGCDFATIRPRDAEAIQVLRQERPPAHARATPSRCRDTIGRHRRTRRGLRSTIAGSRINGGSTPGPGPFEVAIAAERYNADSLIVRNPSVAECRSTLTTGAVTISKEPAPNSPDRSPGERQDRQETLNPDPRPDVDAGSRRNGGRPGSPSDVPGRVRVEYGERILPTATYDCNGSRARNCRTRPDRRARRRFNVGRRSIRTAYSLEGSPGGGCPWVFRIHCQAGLPVIPNAAMVKRDERLS